MTTLSYASVYTLEGNELCSGLQLGKYSEEAAKAAVRHAKEINQPVELVDYDGVWMVEPDGTFIFSEELS